jgi:glucose-1-phosphate thymidylyltransferase
MIFYPIDTLLKSGIKEILVITTNSHQQLFREILSDYKGVTFQFACQDAPNGIAEAISIGKDFIGGDNVCLVMGDTIIDGEPFMAQLKIAIKAADVSANATIFVADNHEDDQYGIVTYNHTTKEKQIEGKTDTSYFHSITGLYVFPNRVVKKLEGITPLERGLLEITAVHKHFQKDEKLRIQKLDKECCWFAPSNFEDLIKVNNYFYKNNKNK